MGDSDAESERQPIYGSNPVQRAAATAVDHRDGVRGVNGAVTPFPAFEVYATPAGGNPVSLVRTNEFADPIVGGPLGLFIGQSQRVSGTAQLPPPDDCKKTGTCKEPQAAPATANRLLFDAADVGKRGACHLFRHTMATLMLEGGADIRFIQAMLGQADLKTTQIYTHVAIRQLQEIYRATHPAKLERDKREIEEKLEAEEAEDV
jgi:hypothetical protein